MPRTFEDDLISDGRNAFVSDFSKVVEYSRGTLTNTSLQAVPVRPERLVDLELTAPTETTELDWLVVAIDLTLDDDAITPRSGDRIKATMGGIEQVFEVVPRGPMPCQEWYDAQGTMLRIRTKRIRNG